MDEKRKEEQYYKDLEEEQYYKDLDAINKARLSNSQLFDKSILYLSSAGLGLSAAFIKDIVQLDTKDSVWEAAASVDSVWILNSALLLYLSWVLFVGAIACTLCSFLKARQGLTNLFMQMKREHKTMRVHGTASGDVKAAEINAVLVKTSDRLAIWSFRTYIYAVILTVIFLILN